MAHPCEVFKTNNPFINQSVTAAEIWNLNHPDIELVYKDEFNKIINLVQKKQQDPSAPLAILVLGEGGTGKTQLLARAAYHCSEIGEQGCSLVNVRPIQDEDPVRHLMQNLITDIHDDFRRRPDAPLCKRLLSEILYDCFTQKGIARDQITPAVDAFFAYHDEKRGNCDTLAEVMVKWLHKQDKSLEPEFLHVLFQVCNQVRRTAAVQWMRGEILDEDDANLLGLSVDPDTNETREITETETRNHLATFGKVLARYNLNLLVCFDQLDICGDYQKLGIMVQTILTLCPGMIPIIFARTGPWNETIKENFEKPLLDTLSVNSVILRGCTKEQAEVIIKARVQQVLGSEWKTPYNWLIQKVAYYGGLSGNPNPRAVLLAANKVIEQECSGSILPHDETLSESYTSFYNHIHDFIDSTLPAFDKLTQALMAYLSGTGVGFTKTGKYIITKNGWFLIINASDSHSVIRTCFRDGIKHLQNSPHNRALYIDPRSSITKITWDETNREKIRFEKLGGIIYQPNKKELSKWYALTELQEKISEGDILYPDGTKATTADLYAFIRKRDDLVSLETIAKRSRERIISSTLTRPEYAHSIDHILQMCTQRGLEISRGELLEFCSSHAKIIYTENERIQVNEYWKLVGDEICSIMKKLDYAQIAVTHIIYLLSERKTLFSPLSEIELLYHYENGVFADQFRIEKNKSGYHITLHSK